MSDSTPFFQEVRHSLMVRGDGWKSVIEDLPNHISVLQVKELLQSPDQLTFLIGQGHIAGELIRTQLSPEIASSFLNETLTLENITLQWLYRFLIIEGLVEHNRREPLKRWNPMFLHMVEQGLHFLLYMSALLVLIEEGLAVIPYSGVRYAGIPAKLEMNEKIVKDRIAEACEFLHPKAQDYGESFRRHGLPGLLPRLWDKIARYTQLKADNRTGNFEKLEDSALDLLGYCCIAYSLVLELPQELRDSYQPTSVYETESNVMEGANWKKINVSPL